MTDATELDGYTEAFDTVVDSGMFHPLNLYGIGRTVGAVEPQCAVASRCKNIAR